MTTGAMRLPVFRFKVISAGTAADLQRQLDDLDPGWEFAGVVGSLVVMKMVAGLLTAMADEPAIMPGVGPGVAGLRMVKQ